MKNKYRMFPRSAAQYNDVLIHCPNCHKQIIVFEGFRKTQICYKCNSKFKDKLYKRHCAAFKLAKANTI